MKTVIIPAKKMNPHNCNSVELNMQLKIRFAFTGEKVLN